jgi:succinate dehydrogenase/fumarate reductase flavoprotein subunit
LEDELSENGHSQPFRVRAARHEPVARRESALPSRGLRFDVETDVVVVGSGCAGLASSLFTSWQGNDVVLLEKAPEVGGTTLKAAFIYWVPNNGFLQEQGLEDREEDFLRYVARISRPEKYDPDSPTFGQSEWEFALYKAIYESAWPAAKLLHDRGALPARHAPHWTDYWENLEEDKVANARHLTPDGVNEDETDGGLIAIRGMTKAAEAAGVDIRTGHRVQRLVVNDDNAAVGVVATTVDGETVRVGARKAVLFGSGGFTHDKDLRDNFLAVPVVGGCAARSNEGDFVRIGSAVGAQLRNMQFAWRCAVNLQKVVEADPHMQGTFAVAGDSMILVNYKGERAFNEKLPYNELVQRMYDWDPLNCEFPNRVMVQIWDQYSQNNSAKEFFGNSIVPDDSDQSHIIRGDTLGELVENIRERLARFHAETGNVTLVDDFLPRLEQTIARWDEMSENGVDEDYRRGDREVELTVFAGPLSEEAMVRKNPVMRAFNGEGPYYACLLSGGTLDTKGGPRINPSAQVVDDNDEPIPGLYGVGNCVASASGRAYWAGGGTLGPMIAFAYRAAQAIDHEPVRSLHEAKPAVA